MRKSSSGKLDKSHFAHASDAANEKFTNFQQKMKKSKVYSKLNDEIKEKMSKVQDKKVKQSL